METEKLYQVYVLQNAGKRFYIGLSEDVAVRLEQHNRGESKWTKSRGPWSLVRKSDWKTLGDARKLETRLKKQKGGRGFYVATGLQRSSAP
jgi:putative endonuclease